MPSPIKRHKPASAVVRTTGQRNLKVKQQANGRTLALNGAAWGRLRALVISEQPLCAQCQREGRIEHGNEVDHIDNDASNNERCNLENLCHACHSLKTQRDQHGSTMKGCDVDGMPLDPHHHWNKKITSTERSEPLLSLHARIRS